MIIETVRWRILLVALAGWVNRHQLEVIDYLREENRVLKEQLGGRRPRLTDAQRRRLASRGHALGRSLLVQVATLVTPDTILRWHRQLIARKWTRARRGVGRPGVLNEIRQLTVRMATENPTWGYRRIQGALKNLGHRVARTTIATILRDHGISPVPERPMSWPTFLAAHWDTIAAADFFTTEVWTARGLVTYYTVFVIELASRRVHLVGSTPHPDDAFVVQIARTLTQAGDGALVGHRVLICDRDTNGVRRFGTRWGPRGFASSRRRTTPPTATHTRNGLSVRSKKNASTASLSSGRRTCGERCANSRRTTTRNGITKAYTTT